MGINLKQIGKDILTAYIVIAVDVLEGFKTNFNIISWSSNKVATVSYTHLRAHETSHDLV